jgi:hypothetical protein
MQLQNALAQMDERALQQSMQKQDKFARLAQWADTPEKWAQAVQQAEADGLQGASQIPFEQRGAKLAGMLSVKDQLDQEWKRREFQLRERDVNSSIGARNAAKGAGGIGAAPSGYQWVRGANGSAELAPIKGGPAEASRKKMNDEQAKALGYAKRITDANIVLEDPMYAKSLVSTRSNVGSSVPFIGNALVSSDYQIADQAVRNFINAQMRRESGAVISPEEFANARIQYIPVWGDGEEVLERKRQARARALENLYVSSGPSGLEQAQDVAPPSLSATQAPQSFTGSGVFADIPRGNGTTGKSIGGFTVTKVK